MLVRRLRHARGDAGATVIEYGFIAMLVAVALAITFVLLRPAPTPDSIRVEQPKPAATASATPGASSVSVPMLGTIADPTDSPAPKKKKQRTN